MLTIYSTPYILLSKNAQVPHKHLDSVKKVVYSDGLRINDLPNIIKIQRQYRGINIDSALTYSDIEISLFEQTDNENLAANARLVKSSLLYSLISTDSAITLLQTNIENKKLISDSLLAKSFLLLAKVEIQKKLVHQSFQHAMIASEIFGKIKDSSNSAAFFEYIACVYIRGAKRVSPLF